ncbi:hypothetical protein K0T92_24310 [Paenibacillus oenotherae]|uniref:Uncharacterized protein n=1 Tax=Paenibacillus oenotherae TaxID=1435645 RepID=A0ABS7DD34_9BACL|nr:hypothetical protein [Paenibacillus oenotherae]MBW7477839.1 hypothetical protein [Paenibacillus oenotherae]
MSKKQVQEHFNWFVKEVPARIEILIEAIEASGLRNIEKFDMTPESLNPLWGWVKERINTVPKSHEELNELSNTLPSWILEDMSDWKLDSGTVTLAIDVSLYFAEVFLREYPHLQWGFISKPKSDVDINKPVVMGFKGGALHPPTVVINLCRSHVKGNQDKDLTSLFEAWRKFI